MSARGGRAIRLCWRPAYALAALALLVVEVLIALFVRDGLVRPYLGDTLAVMLVYCGLRAVTALSAAAAAATALLVAVTIEFGQYFRILRLVGLEDNVVARTVLGSGFEPKDFLFYAAGSLVMLAIERLRLSHPARTPARRA